MMYFSEFLLFVLDISYGKKAKGSYVTFLVFSIFLLKTLIVERLSNKTFLCPH